MTFESTDENRRGVEEYLPFLDPIISRWFNAKYDSLTVPQKKVIPLIHKGENVLVSSPTGTGKTLTGFLAIINELFLRSRDENLEDKIECVYISPLKALANDINRNLNEPLGEIYKLAEENKMDLPRIRVGVRSGDTTQNDRQKMLKKPPHILITTPESLALSLTAPKFKEKFKDVKYVIVDEIHEVSSSKRGTLLSLNLERLEELSHGFIRIGLSATQAPLDKISNFLCGYENGEPRKCHIIDVDLKRGLDLMTLTPVDDLTTSGFEVANERMYDILVELIESHKTTLIFTNTRSATEHVAIRLKARGIDSLEAHHSSLGKEIRLGVEEKLKNGELKCVISSTSLELGIDIGSVDLVVQIGSPKSVSKGLQRIGRAGHSITKLSQGRFVVFNLDDLVECAVLTKAAYDREIDRVSIPEGALDVLSQAVVGMSLEKTWTIEESYNLIRRSYPYRNLAMDDFMSVINYLAGRIENNTIYSKIWFDEEQKVFGKKRSTRMIYFMNVGTIPDDSDYRVIDLSGRHLGQLSDKFVERMTVGDIFVLGARTYAFIRTRGNRVIVRDATGLKPTIPSWTGEMLPRSYDLGSLIGKFRDYIVNNLEREDLRKWLMLNYHLDENGARSIISYIRAQSKFQVPTEKFLYTEGYRENGLYSIIFLVPLGRRVNDALSRAYAQAIANTYETNTRVTVTDDGFMLTVESAIPIKNVINLIDPQNFMDYVKRSIMNTTVFKERFRQCATRSLMVLRRYKGHEVSVVIQQLRSDKVLKAIENIPNFPVVTETYREIMNDMMDVPSALKYVEDVISTGSFKVKDYSEEASPFSLSLILAGVSDVVLMEERSKLMKELQSRIVDRVYGTEYMDFSVKDPRVVENFYRSRVPHIEERETYLQLCRHFPMVDITKSRFNSPFPYSSIDTMEMGRELVKENMLWSVNLRGIYWVLPERFALFKELFARNRILNESEQIVLKECSDKTAREIQQITGLDETQVRNDLISLESMYLIRRKFKKETVSYEIIGDIPECTYTLEDLLFDQLNSMGPMTLDEISVRFPVKKEDLKKTLDLMVSKGIIGEEYVTPVFARQYIIKGDLEKILKHATYEPSVVRLGKYLRHFTDTNEYMENLGFYTKEESLRARISHDKDKLDEISIPILRGKFFKHRLTVMNRNLAMALQKLRESPLEEKEAEAYDFLKYGGATLEAVSKHLSMDWKDVRQILNGLEHRILVAEEDGLFSRIKVDETMERNRAMKIVLDYFGPLTQNEIMNSFWFHIKAGDLDGIETHSGPRGTYFGELPKAEGETMMLPIGDPVSIITGRLVTESSGLNTMFFSRNTMVAVLALEMTQESLWIDDLIIEKDDMAQDFFDYVDEKYFSKGISVIITGIRDNLWEELEKNGYGRTRNIAIKSKENTELLYGDELFRRSLYCYSNIADRRRTVMDSITEAKLGIRDATEAHANGVRSTDLDSYFYSDILFNFNGPMNLNSKGTMETISLYRTLRGKKIEKQDMEILKIVMDYPKTEEDVVLDTKISHDRAVASLKNLWINAVVCKDSDSKYRYVIEKYQVNDAATTMVKKIVEYFGFIDFRLFSEITGSVDLKLYNYAIDNLKRHVSMKEAIILDSRRSVLISSKFMENQKKNNKAFILSPRDLFYYVFKNTIKTQAGGGRSFLLIENLSIKSYSKVKRNKNELLIEDIEGDNETRKEFIKELSNSGYSLKF
ncbi:MAG: ATP-dependent helicase [Cuniculiplasma sp.]